MLKIVSKSESDTLALAEAVAKKLSGATVVAFYGGLAAGKTTFTRGLARALGVKDEISSPTFALVHEHHGAVDFYHFDMYRVSTWEDLYLTGFFEYYDSGAVLAVEWSENIENALPENTLRITLERTENENERIIIIEGSGKYENFSC